MSSRKEPCVCWTLMVQSGPSEARFNGSPRPNAWQEAAHEEAWYESTAGESDDSLEGYATSRARKKGGWGQPPVRASDFKEVDFLAAAPLQRIATMLASSGRCRHGPTDVLRLALEA